MRLAKWLVLLLLLSLPVMGRAQSDYTYTTNNGTITITLYTGAGGDVSIPGVINGLPVTSIGNYAFQVVTNLTSVTMPDSVTSIGQGAFQYCPILASVSFGSGVISIGSQACYQCPSLTSVTIPDHVTSIGQAAFAYCASLGSASLGSRVTSIGASAFQYCTSLGSITIPDNVVSLGQGAFQYCTSLSGVTIGNGVTSLGANTFSGCASLSGIALGSHVSSIGASAFNGCTSLSGITIPASVTSLGTAAFSGCANLANVVISSGNGVISLGTSAFAACTRLASVSIGSHSASIGDQAFYGCASLASVNVSNGLTTIGVNAFGGCARLNSLTFPDSTSFTSIGANAFANCTSLISVTLGDTLTNLGPYAFNNCTGLAGVVLGNGLTIIQTNTFYGCTGLSSVIIGNNVTSIGAQAFYGCTILTGINIPNHVTSIGEAAFFNCIHLGSVTIGDNVASIGGFAFASCPGLYYVCFQGNAPTNYGSSVFALPYPQTINYISGTSGWGATFAGIPTAVCAQCTGVNPPPALAIANLSAGLRLSNAVFTVTGTTTDSATVTNVFYSLNGSAWTSAATDNQWGNWTVPVTLVGGPNTFSAYLADANGEISAISTVNFVCIISGLLTVSTNGLGALSPNDNGALLQIGQSFAITATAGAGFVFTNWTGGTGLPLVILTNKPALQFVMVPNLMLSANFLDVTKPTLSITNVTSGMNVSNAAFTVKGVAGDNASVSNVLYSLNGSDWTPASTTNQWTNWTAPVTLLPGTNTFAAYALDTGGNSSTTNKVNLIYVVSALLSVTTNGPGALSPNDNGALLQVGKNYTITATAKTGFALTNWLGGTDLPLTLLTNRATLQFTMAPNLMLQATFVDVTRPTLAVTNVTTTLSVSNAAFTVKGTAADNAAVSNVLYSLNGSAWTLATTTNQWTNWTAPLTLQSGTNSLAAYSVDTAGNPSLTNKVNLVYVVSAPLTVSTNGLGVLSPNDNGAWLQIGKNYAITATPATGFVFTNWLGGTNLPLGFITNKATVQFAMLTNMMLQATFADVQKPVVTITSPTAGQRVSNAVFTVSGKASDNWQVASVWWQLNGGDWTNATGTTNWSASLNLAPGTNAIKAYAMDNTGNLSLTNSVNIDFVVTNQLGVQFAGLGTQSPNYSNAWLEVGRNYTMTATPATGFVFTNWTVSTNWLGGVITNKPTVQFRMASNLTLQATFVDVQKPVLTITNLTAGQRLTNAAFTIRGKASDNWQVASVWLQLNGGDWINATGTTSWYASVNFQPGTNAIKAYAVDNTGNLSLTNSVNVDFVVSNQLSVQFVGLGTLSPNYSNAWLEVGRNYALTATPSTGFVFTNWTVSTNWLDGTITNKPVVQFKMASNLTLQATFADVARPVATITNLASGRHVLSGLISVMGTASDNWQVAAVSYQVNTSEWLPATSTNNFKNWSVVDLSLPVGTNLIRAYAQDSTGNYSLTNIVSVVATNGLRGTSVVSAQHVVAPPTAVLVTGTRMTANGLAFNLQITGAASGRIQVSTNLLDWDTVTSFSGTNATIGFSDPTAASYSQRYYRAVVP